MRAFFSLSRRQAVLRRCRSCAVSRRNLARRLYVYSAGTILDHYTRLDAALAPLDHLICYAVKANSNRAILKLLADAGAGFDIVSGGELFRVLAAGGDPAKCTFAGVGKSQRRNRVCARTGCLQLQCRERSGARAHRSHRRRKKTARADRVACQSRCRSAHARVHLDRLAREQVRNRA